MNKYQLMLEAWNAKHPGPIFEVNDSIEGVYDFFAYRIIFASGHVVPVFVNSLAFSELNGEDFASNEDALFFFCECIEAISNDEIVALEPVVE